MRGSDILHSIDVMFEHGGEAAVLIRDGEKVADIVLLFRELSSKIEEPHVTSKLGTELKKGDVVHLVKRDETYPILRVERRMSFGEHIGYNGYIETAKSKAMHARHQSQSQSISIGTNYGIVGSQHHATVNLSLAMDQIEEDIDVRGGADAGDLRLALAEFRSMMESEGFIKRGALAKFEGVIERHSWFSGAITGVVLNYLYGRITGLG